MRKILPEKGSESREGGVRGEWGGEEKGAGEGMGEGGVAGGEGLSKKDLYK